MVPYITFHIYYSFTINICKDLPKLGDVDTNNVAIMAQSGGTYHAIASTSTLTVQYWGKSKFNTCVYILYCGEELSVTC